MELTAEEAKVVRDLVLFYLHDGTHPVDVEAVITLELRFAD